MSQLSWDGRPLETFGCNDTTLLARAAQDQWFNEYSSLAGALGERKNRGVSSRSGPASLGDREVHQERDAAPALSETPGRFTNRPTSKAAGCTHRDGGYGRSNDDNSNGNDDSNEYILSNEDYSNEYESNNEYDSVLWTVIHPRGRVHHFCQVGQCIYWHTDSKQIWRHRNAHFRGRYGWLCPNQTDTCPNFESDFARDDGVREHCKKFSDCGGALKVNGGKVKFWGTPVNDGDLVKYDPKYHISYWGSYGRI